MQEIVKSLENEALVTYTEAEGLDAAAIAWATYSLRTFSGKLLKRALGVSIALTEFTSERDDGLSDGASSPAGRRKGGA